VYFGIKNGRTLKKKLVKINANYKYFFV